MDYEKKYKEANDKVAIRFGTNVAKEIFTDLYESEDEKIRKELIAYHRSMAAAMNGNRPCVHEAWIAWLEKQGDKEKFIKKELGCIQGYREEAIRRLKEIEKQGERNPVNDTDEDIVEAVKDTSILDMVEPKFKVGDWITNGRYNKLIVGVNSDWPFYMFKDGTSERIKDVDKKYHLWTIQDAKDGDVLVASDGSIFLFADVVDCACKYYVALATDNYIKINKEEKGGYWETSRAVYPATKEQRDTLMKAMADAGWEFDFEKKELKKIEQKLAWSEEDEKILNTTISFLSEYAAKGYENAVMCMDWLKSLKQRIGE